VCVCFFFTLFDLAKCVHYFDYRPKGSSVVKVEYSSRQDHGLIPKNCMHKSNVQYAFIGDFTDMMIEDQESEMK